ncbi:S8 family peptidase [Ideonella sp.]|uniref:S8 family peptidase n=1 Tax=Ideonella sp. TaxID=1929293 RepID=UPI002B499916|nr:S8 family peptidase [Ideonella sp.]HJV67506.1 S8 family peptidase [Ideonella sp.]
MPRFAPRFSYTLIAAALATLTGGVLAGGQPDKVVAELQQPHRQFVPAEMLVQFKPGVAQALRQAALDKVGAKFLERLRGDLHRISLPQGANLAAAVRALHAQDAVDFAEPNWVYQTTKVSDDTYYVNGSLWGMYGDTSPLFQNQYGSQAGEAWDAGHFSCKGVMVGVIDEGVQYTHPDLKPNHWKNPNEIDGNGIDDDGNGFIDDTHGWDFDANNKSVYDGTQDDHGTHVSGTIGGKGRNGIGVAGMCWKIKMLHVKFLGVGGGTTANAIKSVDYVTDLKQRHSLNLVATNNSWGGGGFSQGLKDSIDAAGAADILFIAAAGNNGSNNDSVPFYPASYTSASLIAVASLNSNGTMSSFSNYGATSVDLGAPGAGIFSTVPTNSYASYSGTSMATPHVTGAVALYAKTHPGLTAAQLKAAILNTTTPTASMSGKTVTGGRLNVSTY